nr:MAG TPA: hypothetical protein [Bacteriophage sp.]
MKMTTTTDNFNLDLYETGDPANLNDQYNESMHIIDENMLTIANNASTALNKVAEVKTTADTALNLAQTNKQDITNIQGNVSTLNTNVNTLDANLTALGANSVSDATVTKNRINNNTTNIASINKYITANEIFNMRGDDIIVTFGDSYASAINNTSWAFQTANKLGWTLKNYAIAGAGYIPPNTTYQSEFATAQDDTTYQHDRVSLVIIGGSRNSNDGYSGSIKTAATKLFNDCKTEYPNARIIAIPMLWDKTTVSDYWRYNASEIEQAAIETGIESIPWAWTWNLGIAANFDGDNIHPNASGTTIISNYIMRYLTGTYTGRHETWVWRKPGNPAAGMLSINASGGTISYAFQMLGGNTASEWTEINGVPQWAWADTDGTNSVYKWSLQASNGANDATLFKINNNGTFGIQPYTTTGSHGTPNGLMGGHFTTAW